MQILIYSPSFLMITTIDNAHVDVEGRIILSNNNLSIKSANFPRNLDATGRKRCAIELSPPTSNHIRPRVLQGVKHFLLQSIDGDFFILIVETCIFLQLTVYQDRLFGHRRTLSSSKVLPPPAVRLDVDLHLPRIIELLHDSTLI